MKKVFVKSCEHELCGSHQELLETLEEFEASTAQIDTYSHGVQWRHYETNHPNFIGMVVSSIDNEPIPMFENEII